MSASETAIISLRQVGRSYFMGETEVRALDEVSLDIEEGDYVCIMGPSGCGKSTLLNLLGCLDQATRGEYYLGGKPVSRLDDNTLSDLRGSRLGFVFQSYNLVPQLTVLENIEVPMFYRGLPAATSQRRAMALAERVGLGDRVHHRPAELSGGQQQRVAIARALANDPLVILADEATGNLDTKSGEEILAIFDRLNAEGRTLVFVTHDPEMARRAHRVIRFRDGRVEREENLREKGAGEAPESTAVGWARRDDASGRRFSFLKLGRGVLLGLKSLWLHRLRSLLTALGIVFGVASVIAMLAIGEGASFEAQQQIRMLGSQNVIVRSVKPPGADESGGRRSMVIEYGVTARDVRQMLATIPGIRMIVPNREIGDYISHRTRRVDAKVSGVIPIYPEMRNRRVVAGRFFNLLEMEQRRNVCVLNRAAAAKLFPLNEAVGSAVKLDDTYYRVVGVLESVAPMPDEMGTRSEFEMFVPLETMLERYGDVFFKARAGSFEAEKVEFHEVTVVVEDPALVEAKSEAVRHLLASNHDQPDFKVIVPVELLRQAERTKQIFNIVLGSIAAISLVVGGIGIMNIMLASVTERTREIGIRRALGGRRRDIAFQFLVEAVLLSGMGGVLGVALGLAVPEMVTHFSGMATLVKIWVPMLAFTISVCTGIAFGLYPALRAAKLSPVEALRHE